MDRAGNESQKTAGLLVNVPNTLSKALNGEFDESTDNWHLSTFAAGATATMQIDPGSVISGSNSCKVNVSSVTGTDWHIELWQWLSIHPGRKYKITFKAKASTTKTITLGIQQAASPYAMYLGKAHTLTTTVQTFTDSVTINTADQAKLEFFLGSSTATVWIDEVSVIESSTGSLGVDEQENVNPSPCEIFQNYPNPFSVSTTLGFRINKSGIVSLKIFNALGTEVAGLVNKQMPKGEYSIDWNATGLVEGIYFCRMQSDSFTDTKKLVFQK